MLAMPRSESPLLIKCLSRSWSTAHPASHRTPQVDDVVQFLEKKKVTPQVAARLVAILISRGVSDKFLGALPSIINPNDDLEPSDHRTFPETALATWSFAVVVSSIARCTLLTRLPLFSDPFDPLVDKLKTLGLPSSIERSVPSVTTPLELLATSTRVVVKPSSGAPEIDFLPLVQLTNYTFQAEATLLADSLVDLELQKPQNPKPPARKPGPDPISVALPIPLGPTISLSRSPRTPKTPQYPLLKLGRNGPNSSAPELSRRPAYSNKPVHANPNSALGSLPSANSSAFSVGRLSGLSLENRARAGGGNLPSRVAKGNSPTDVVILDSDHDNPESGNVEANHQSDSPSIVESARRRSFGSYTAPKAGFDQAKFRKKLGEKMRGQREASLNNDALDSLPLPPPPDTFYAREQTRKMKMQERNQKKKATREKREERKRDEERKRREQKLKSMRRLSKIVSSDEDGGNVDDFEDDELQRGPRVKRARLHSAGDISGGSSAAGAGTIELIDLNDDVDLKEEDIQLLSSTDEYEMKRSKLMDMIKGHTTNLAPRDLTKIENFLKGDDIFGRHDTVDILLHHDCARSGNHHYLRLIKEPRTVEQVFRSSAF